jgi:hypothetical protein
MKPVRFTGGDNLTGFAISVHRVLIQNELPGNTAKAYELSNAGGRSGYSFGPLQWDLKANHEIDDTPGNTLNGIKGDTPVFRHSHVFARGRRGVLEISQRNSQMAKQKPECPL